MADIYINYGKNIMEMTIQLMEEADIASGLKPDMYICIKPNLVVARPAEGGATTHPEIVEGIIVYLQSHGIKNITITEGSWVGDSTKRAFKSCGYSSLGEKYKVGLIDTKGDEVIRKKINGEIFSICRTIDSCDYLINVPVLKGHCQTDVTCCLKNMKGCIPDSEKRRFHSAGLHDPIALLNTLIKPQLHIVDNICGDLTFEEGGNPVEQNRVMLGFDPVLLDSFGASLMGYRPYEIEHLALAHDYGAGRFFTADTEIRELNADNRPDHIPAKSGQVKRLAAHIEEKSACSACYAALIFALNKTGYGGSERLKIGQGFRGKKSSGTGVGNCCSGCDRYIKGCPPSALDIVELLENG